MKRREFIKSAALGSMGGLLVSQTFGAQAGAKMLTPERSRRAVLPHNTAKRQRCRFNPSRR